MIDIESDIYTAVRNAILAKHPNVSVSEEYISDKGMFPAVTIMESDNSVVRSRRTINVPDADLLMYTVNVYSNKAKGKKAECRAIASTIDEAFANLYFTRTYLETVPNLYNSSIYRMVGRYEAVVGPGTEEGKYIIYQS